MAASDVPMCYKCLLGVANERCYRGEISIQQEDLAPLIETARFLQVKGGIA